MDIVASFNPPRLIEIGDDRYWCKTATIEDLATLIAWIDDVVPGQLDRTMPIAFRSDEAQAALNSPAGTALMLWIMLRSQGVSYERAWQLGSVITPAEKSRAISVLFARRRTYKPSLGTGEDIAEAWWGPLIASLNEHRGMTPDQVGGLTLDQVDALVDEGCKGEQTNVISIDDVQSMWEAASKANGED